MAAALGEALEGEAAAVAAALADGADAAAVVVVPEAVAAAGERSIVSEYTGEGWVREREREVKESSCCSQHDSRGWWWRGCESDRCLQDT